MNEFSTEQMQKLDSAFDALLEKDPPIKSNEELVAKYVSKMRAALDKGWPLSALVEILAAEGIDIKEATLRSYIQRQKKKIEAEQSAVAESATGAKKRRRRSAPAEETPAAAAAHDNGKKKCNKKTESDQVLDQAPVDQNSSSQPGSFALDPDIV